MKQHRSTVSTTDAVTTQTDKFMNRMNRFGELFHLRKLSSESRLIVFLCPCRRIFFLFNVAEEEEGEKEEKKKSKGKRNIKIK